MNERTATALATEISIAGSTLCAAAPSSATFILGRAIAGTGAAGLIQGAITVITYTSTLEKRPLYIGLVVSCFGICACFSPILGGALTDRVNWRWCFWMYVALLSPLAFLTTLIRDTVTYQSVLLFSSLCFWASTRR